MAVTTDEQKLIDAILGGDREGWRTLIDDYAPTIAAKVNRTLEMYAKAFDRSDIEDLTAEIFGGLLQDNMRALRQFEGRASLGTWLAVIAHRTALRFSRKSRVRNHHQLSLDDVAEPVSHPPNFSGEDRDEIDRVLAELSPNDQLLLRLHFYEEKSYREISQAMNISMNSVGPKLQRAQQRLKKRMGSP